MSEDRYEALEKREATLKDMAVEDMALEELNSSEFDELLHSFEVMESTANSLFNIRKIIDEIRELSADTDIDISGLVDDVESVIEDME